MKKPPVIFRKKQKTAVLFLLAVLFLFCIYKLYAYHREYAETAVETVAGGGKVTPQSLFGAVAQYAEE